MGTSALGTCILLSSFQRLCSWCTQLQRVRRCNCHLLEEKDTGILCLLDPLIVEMSCAREICIEMHKSQLGFKALMVKSILGLRLLCLPAHCPILRLSGVLMDAAASKEVQGLALHCRSQQFWIPALQVQFLVLCSPMNHNHGALGTLGEEVAQLFHVPFSQHKILIRPVTGGVSDYQDTCSLCCETRLVWNFVSQSRKCKPARHCALCDHVHSPAESGRGPRTAFANQTLP